jgi:hypothetical protein
MSDENIIVPIYSQGGVPSPQRNDRADLIDKIKPDPIVEITRHMLLGEEWTGNGWKKVKALENDSLTELGAWKIAAELQGIANISTSVSKYKEVMIKARLKRLAKNTQLQLVANWRLYGVKNKAMFYSVHNLVFSICMAVLFQAGEGSIQELLKGTVQENRNINTEKKEPGKLRRLLGMA